MFYFDVFFFKQTFNRALLSCPITIQQEENGCFLRTLAKDATVMGRARGPPSWDRHGEAKPGKDVDGAIIG